ncbi:MAG: hypothetical protein A2X93_02565 [Deltaproteobacteria bacterium GWC2_56_8]|nr:MAG: hypothetical protein A2X93_02565 [Deltaproteobacteria bacterium GWC2_56_8]
MNLRPYQPHRKEFLINTDWGTAKDVVSREEAKRRGLVLFKGRWVTKEEQALLRDEYHAYHSIRMTAILLICFSALFLAIMTLYARSGGIVFVFGTDTVEAVVLYIIGCIAGFAGLISGIGILKYRRWARNLAAFVVLLPAFPLGLIGLYYLFRKTARRIFNEGEA